MILGWVLAALLVPAVVVVGLLYDDIGRRHRRIGAAESAVGELERRRGLVADPVEQAGIEARLRYARAHVDDLRAGHRSPLQRRAAAAVARGLKLAEPAS